MHTTRHELPWPRQREALQHRRRRLLSSGHPPHPRPAQATSARTHARAPPARRQPRGQRAMPSVRAVSPTPHAPLLRTALASLLHTAHACPRSLAKHAAAVARHSRRATRRACARDAGPGSWDPRLRLRWQPRAASGRLEDLSTVSVVPRRPAPTLGVGSPPQCPCT